MPPLSYGLFKPQVLEVPPAAPAGHCQMFNGSAYTTHRGPYVKTLLPACHVRICLYVLITSLLMIPTNVLIVQPPGIVLLQLYQCGEKGFPNFSCIMERDGVGG